MGMELGEVGCMIQIQVQMHYSPPCNLLYDMMGSLMPLYVTATRRQWSMVNGQWPHDVLDVRSTRKESLLARH